MPDTPDLPDSSDLADSPESLRRKPREPDHEMTRLVQPDGLAVRRRRHDHGWSPRDLVRAISDASFAASGLKRTLSPNQLEAIEERAERIPYASLILLADGLDCDPVDLLAADLNKE